LDNERNTKMKKVFLSLLVIIIALGLLGAAGYAGYRYGFRQGMIVASSGANGNDRPVIPGFGLGPRGMPMHQFGFRRDFAHGGFGMMRRGGFGFGFFALLGLLVRLLFWGLILAGIVWLISRSGWRLIRTAPAATTTTTTVVETPPTPPVEENREDG
jgi:hypothetical protein